MTTLSLLWLILQNAAAVPGAGPNDIAHFDLAKLPRATTPNCAISTPAEEIVVCGRKTTLLPKLDPRFEPQPWQPHLRIAGADVTPEAEQRYLPGGISGPAAMIRFKWKF